MYSLNTFFTFDRFISEHQKKKRKWRPANGLRTPEKRNRQHLECQPSSVSSFIAHTHTHTKQGQSHLFTFLTHTQGGGEKNPPTTIFLTDEKICVVR